jgi:hypothetical protein
LSACNIVGNTELDLEFDNIMRLDLPLTPAPSQRSPEHASVIHPQVFSAVNGKCLKMQEVCVFSHMEVLFSGRHLSFRLSGSFPSGPAFATSINQLASGFNSFLSKACTNNREYP